jgi:hypothetical protein
VSPADKKKRNLLPDAIFKNDLFIDIFIMLHKLLCEAVA